MEFDVGVFKFLVKERLEQTHLLRNYSEFVSHGEC